MNNTPLALYNPALLPADVLLGEFTARRALLDTLLRIIRENSRGKPPQHAVLIGARGSGKTTTLWAVAHSIARDPELARQWQPVVFDEESRRVGDLADFWLEAIRQLEFATHSSAGRAEQLLAGDHAELEDRARKAFLEAVDRTGKRALLCIDNLNELFTAIHDPEPMHRLRAFLMADDRVMFLGAATQLFDAIIGLDKPFFEFFRLFELSPLTLDDMRAALLAMADHRGNTHVRETIEQRPGTIHALHVLTGGNPRLIKTFYRLLSEGLRGDVRQDLERLIDEFTPYFKSILDALPVQQQRIVDAVALAWEPVEVATVAHVTRLPSNQVSAQLRNLVRSGLINEVAGSPKRKLYLLADRFSNVHYLMRHGRIARRRFDWFVLTLRVLFPDPEQAEAIAHMAGRTICAGADGLRDTRDLLSSALAHAENDDSRLHILHATFKKTWDQETYDQLCDWLDLDGAKQHLPSSAGELDIAAYFAGLPRDLRKKVGYKPENVGWWYQLIDILEEKAAWRLTEAAYRKAIELDPKDAYPWNGLGNLLQNQLGQPADAEADYRKAIELDPKGVYRWNGCGNLLQNQLGQPADVEAAYRKAIELDPKFAYPWNGLGNLLQYQLSRPADAEAAYRKAIELDPKFAHPWNGLGNLLQDYLGRPADAEAAYRKAIELDPKSAYPWNGLGNLLQYQLSRPADAEAAYRKAIELNPKDAYPWNGLGNLLQYQLDRPADAEAAYRKAIELDPKLAYPQSGLARVLSKTPGREVEVRAVATRGLSLKPDSGFARRMFRELCYDDASSWREALSTLAIWCSAHPKDRTIFDFTVNGFIRYARLTSANKAAKMLDALADPLPFETLCDAFHAHTDRERLHRLAPERRTAVLEILRKLST